MEHGTWCIIELKHSDVILTPMGPISAPISEPGVCLRPPTGY